MANIARTTRDIGLLENSIHMLPSTAISQADITDYAITCETARLERLYDQLERMKDDTATASKQLWEAAESAFGEYRYWNAEANECYKTHRHADFIHCTEMATKSLAQYSHLNKQSSDLMILSSQILRTLTERVMSTTADFHTDDDLPFTDDAPKGASLPAVAPEFIESALETIGSFFSRTLVNYEGETTAQVELTAEELEIADPSTETAEWEARLELAAALLKQNGLSASDWPFKNEKVISQNHKSVLEFELLAA